MMELLRLLQFYLLPFLRCDMSKSSFPMDIRRRQPVWPWAGASVHSSSDIFLLQKCNQSEQISWREHAIKRRN